MSSCSSSPKSWTPEPLVPDLPLDSSCQLKSLVISSKPGKYIEVNGRQCLNAATNDYLNLAGSPRLEQVSIEAVRRYGVGSCGPRAFYGTMDVHLELEMALANFLDVHEVVLYSFGFSTIASAIPAYAKATDFVLYDEQCNFAIQKGITASRSKAIKFRHNDAQDLDQKLCELETDYKRRHGKSKLARTFLIIESIYAKTGDLCSLHELVEVAKRHKTRVFMDESRSFGVLGAQGKGVTQQLGVEMDDIDLIMVSLENALCSYGGFCAGSTFIIDHQRLAGTGYCFSASLPPFQCSAALESLKMIQEEPERLARAQALFAYAQDKLANLTHLKNISHLLSPLKILVLKSANGELPSKYEANETKLLGRICDDILEKEHIAIPLARYLDDEESTSPLASIRLALNAGMSYEDVDRIQEALEKYSIVRIAQVAGSPN